MKLFESKNKVDKNDGQRIQEAKTFNERKAQRLKEAVDASKVKTPKDWSKAIEKEISILQREKIFADGLNGDLDGLLKALAAKAKFPVPLTKKDVLAVEFTDDSDNKDLVMPTISLKASENTAEFEFEGSVEYKGAKAFVGWFEEDISFMF